MPVDVTITGFEDFNRFAAALDRSPSRLRSQYRRRMTRAGQIGVEAAHVRAERILPHRGGLAHLVALTPIVVVFRHTSSGASLHIFAVHRDPGINRGLMRHPVFGHNRWVEQRVQPGWFSVPMHRLGPTIREELAKGIREVLDEIRREV